MVDVLETRRRWFDLSVAGSKVGRLPMLKLARRVSLQLAAGLLMLEITGAMLQAAERPNMLVILADDLGYGDLSSYGADDLHTPHIDSVVAGGMKFTNFYANCPVCSPTRAALLSGRYADLVGVPGVVRTRAHDNWGYLHPQAVLLPRLLQEAGYHTAIVGKWHLGLEPPNVPNDRGFDFFHGFLGDMMDDYYDHRRHGINYMRRNREEIDPQGHATDLFTEWACAFLRQHEAGRPFFLYLAYNAPHSPIQPPENWFQRVRRREPDISQQRAKLVALIEHMDDGIGRVLECLRTTGLAKQTIVVFSSDNGGALRYQADNGPLRDGKGSVYEGGLKVPTAISWAGTVVAGSRTAQRAMSMDILPTLLDAAGMEAPDDIDGVSFLPTLLGQQQPELRSHWFFRRREGGLTYGGKTIEAVVHGPWKLLQNSPYAPLELYHLADDPLEQHDLKDRERQVFRRLAAELREEIQRYGSVPWQQP